MLAENLIKLWLNMIKVFTSETACASRSNFAKKATRTQRRVLRTQWPWQSFTSFFLLMGCYHHFSKSFREMDQWFHFSAKTSNLFIFHWLNWLSRQKYWEYWAIWFITSGKQWWKPASNKTNKCWICWWKRN